MPSRIDPYVDQIREWTEQGQTTREIAERLGCSDTLVAQLMRRQGIPRRPTGKRGPDRQPRPSRLDEHIEQIREWTAQGWRLGRIAEALGCSKQTVCNAMRKHGIDRHPQYSCPGEHNPAWKGGRYFDDDGYVLVYAPGHPYATKSGRVREHRLVMEQQLGRYLLPTEVVDHIDGNRQNNDPSNLRVFAQNSEHLRATLTGRKRAPKAGHQGEASQPAANHAASGSDDAR